MQETVEWDKEGGPGPADVVDPEVAAEADGDGEGGNGAGVGGGEGRRRRWRRERRERRRRWKFVLLGGLGVLVLYYGIVVGSLRQESSTVSLDDDLAHPADRVTLQVEAANLDPSTGSFDVRIRPVPRGDYVGEQAGELAQPLRLIVASPGEPPANFEFPAQQPVDPVGASIGTTTGAHRFPFDRPRMDYRFEATTGETAVPLDVEIADGTEGWNLSGRVRPSDDRDGAVAVEMVGGREMLSVSFAVFYIAGIVVVALITVAVIGGAIARSRVGFDQVIWLGAMLVAIPAVRNEMPGVPPIGTTVDVFVFLPSVVIVGVALLAAIVVLVVNEAGSGGSEPAEG